MSVQRTNVFIGDVYLSVFGANEPGDEAVLYLHGFPGPTIDNPVVSLAEMIAETMTARRVLYAPRYSGLAESNGKFSFLSSVYDGLSILYHILAKRHSRVSIVGYSWGGVVALNCFSQIPKETQGKLVLLAPVTYFPAGDAAKDMAKALLHDVPLSLKSQSVETIVRDWDLIGSTHSPYAAAKRVDPHDIVVFQGSRDEVVPKILTDKFVEFVGDGVTYSVFEEPHSFENKPALMSAINNAIGH